MAYRIPKRMFEDSGFVDPEASYYVYLDNVVSTKKQDIKTMVDQGRYFFIFAPPKAGRQPSGLAFGNNCIKIKRMWLSC